MSSDHNLPKISSTGVVPVTKKEFATYEDILDYAHQCGIKSLEVNMLQNPSNANEYTCICRARVETEDGRIVADIGVASPATVPKGCAESIPHIASTLCKLRALSDAFNVRCMTSDAYIPPYEGAKVHIIDADFLDIGPRYVPALKASQDGGGAKPASDKQLALITKIVENRGGSPEDMSIEMCGKRLDQLQGGEANTIIKHLTKK